MAICARGGSGHSSWSGARGRGAAHLLSADGLGGLASYPVSANVDGRTRVVVQYESDGIVDSHYIYRQLEEVKHQYGCFFDTYVRTGTPVVVAPGPLSAACE